MQLDSTKLAGLKKAERRKTGEVKYKNVRVTHINALGERSANRVVYEVKDTLAEDGTPMDEVCGYYSLFTITHEGEPTYRVTCRAKINHYDLTEILVVNSPMAKVLVAARISDELSCDRAEIIRDLNHSGLFQ